MHRCPIHWMKTSTMFSLKWDSETTHLPSTSRSQMIIKAAMTAFPCNTSQSASELNKINDTVNPFIHWSCLLSPSPFHVYENRPIPTFCSFFNPT